MSAPILATSASPTGHSRQRRNLAQHGPSGLRAVAGAASATSVAAGSPPAEARRIGVEVALGEDRNVAKAKASSNPAPRRMRSSGRGTASG
jgi:hypothetical protein